MVGSTDGAELLVAVAVGYDDGDRDSGAISVSAAVGWPNNETAAKRAMAQNANEEQWIFIAMNECKPSSIVKIDY